MNCQRCEDTGEVGFIPKASPMFNGLAGRPMNVCVDKAALIILGWCLKKRGVAGNLLAKYTEDMVPVDCPDCAEMTVSRA